jgi:hypothetical protein
MQTKHTPKGRKAATKPDQLSDLRARFGVKVTAADRKTARTLDALYKNEQTPPLIKSAIFQLFWDVAHFYGLDLPKQFDSKWLSFWETLCAVNRKCGEVTTTIRYTWQPTPEEEAELDAEEKTENDARAIFDFIHSKVESDAAERIRDGVLAILDEAQPFNCLDMFLVAWPLALEKLSEQKASEQ